MADRDQILSILQAYPGAPGQAIEQMRPLADEGHPVARALLAWFMIQQGQLEAGFPYGRTAAEEGYGQIASMYANNLAGNGEPRLREQAPVFVEWALQSGWPTDGFSLAINAAQQGHLDLAWEFVQRSKGPFPFPEPTAKQLHDLLEQARERSGQIGEAAAEVETRRSEAVDAIGREESAVSARRTATENAADELGLVLSDVAAQSLAKDYAKDAKRTEGQARWYTLASIGLGCLSIAASLYGLLTLKEGSGIDTALARAAFGLPFAAFIPYMNSLASSHRKEAWRLRHVELQIRTANPFLTLLDDDRRKETLQALALRFFPGQEAIDKRDDQPNVPVDVIEALRLLLREQQTKAVIAPAPGVSSEMPQI